MLDRAVWRCSSRGQASISRRSWPSRALGRGRVAGWRTGRLLALRPQHFEACVSAGFAAFLEICSQVPAHRANPRLATSIEPAAIASAPMAAALIIACAERRLRRVSFVKGRVHDDQVVLVRDRFAPPGRARRSVPARSRQFCARLARGGLQRREVGLVAGRGARGSAIPPQASTER